MVSLLSATGFSFVIIIIDRVVPSMERLVLVLGRENVHLSGSVE
jgi:hypothetical protein